MSFKLNVTEEILEVLTKMGSMCKTVYIYQHKVGDEVVVDLLHRDVGASSDKTIIYRAKIEDRLIDGVDEFEFELINLKGLINEVKSVSDIPVFEIDDRKLNLTVTHEYGNYRTTLNKLPPNLPKFKKQRDAQIADIKKYALKFDINEKEFTHLKKRLVAVDGITSGGHIEWSFDADNEVEMEFTTINEEGVEVVETKPCYKLLIRGVSSINTNGVEHQFFIPKDTIDYEIESFEFKTNASDLNKVRVGSKANIGVSISYKNQDLNHINKIGFIEKGDISEVSVFNLRKMDTKQLEKK